MFAVPMYCGTTYPKGGIGTITLEIFGDARMTIAVSGYYSPEIVNYPPIPLYPLPIPISLIPIDTPVCRYYYSPRAVLTEWQGVHRAIHNERSKNRVGLSFAFRVWWTWTAAVIREGVAARQSRQSGLALR
jgi:hypothetical protein